MIASILEGCVRDMGLEIDDSKLNALVLFARELKKWNRKFNLTALTSDEDIAIKHLIDSMMVYEGVSGTNRLLDIGSGAGVPSIPLKILLPKTEIMSVDAIGKKITFQRHVVRLLGLQGFEARHARIETLRKTHSGYFDVIISRAFSRLDTFISLAIPLLSVDGKIIAMKGPAAEEEVEREISCLVDNGLHISGIQTYSLPHNKGERCIVIISPSQAP